MKIALIGYGKMGKAIEQVALGKGHEVVLKISEENLNDFTTANLKKADVAIEFTQPEAAFSNVILCFEAGIPVVCGTTGWNEKKEDAVKICLEKNRTFFHAPNFSIGVNLFFALNEQMAKMAEKFRQYEKISIRETHHTQKKDAPSGTAVALANGIIQHVSRLKKWEGLAEPEVSDGNALAVYSVRTGEVAGLHEVKYESEEDSISLVHDAKGRMGFAKGAVAAAEWIIGRKGVFGMKDLLQL